MERLFKRGFLEEENPSTFEAGVLSLQTSLFPQHDLGLRPKNPDAAQGASWLCILQQYKNTPLYDSVTDLIYFLQPEIAKSDKIFSSCRVIVSPHDNSLLYNMTIKYPSLLRKL